MNTIKNKQLSLSLLTALVLSVSSSYANDAEFEQLGYLSGGSSFSHAGAISADGTTVVGRSDDGSHKAYSWTAAGGMVSLGTLGGTSSKANGINDDGSVIVGQSALAGGAYRAFHWTSGAGMVSLGVLTGGTWSEATAVSGDGLTVVGSSESSDSGAYAESFRWTVGGGMVSLGTLTGGINQGEALDVNSDGSVIVGQSLNASSVKEAYRWTSGTGMVGLGYLAGGSQYSEAYGVSADGSVVIGESDNGSVTEAFRWEGGTMTGLGFLSGSSSSHARGVNSDGSVVVGYLENSEGDTNGAFRWSESTGMLSLASWLGLSLTGWSEMAAFDVSDDGEIIVGDGFISGNKETFIARYGSGVIATTAFTQSLASAGSVASQGVSSVNTIMHGAHGHPGAKRALDAKRSMWVAGDVAHDKRHDSKDDFQVAEVGVSYHYNENLAFSAALGKTWGKSTLLYDGNTQSDGQYIAIDTDIKLPVALPLYVTMTYLHGQSDIDIKRGYENAGTNDASLATTRQIIDAARLRLQYQEAKNIYSLAIHPYIEYNVASVTTDGYTETGGGFPTIYNESKETLHDYRIGADADYELNEKNRLILTLEAVRRQEAQGKGSSGQIIGLSTFATDGRSYDQNWIRSTLGIEHALKSGKFTLTLNSSSEGEDPQYWAGLNYTVAF